ncbi:MAG: DUF3798 domain-containing protein [Planctomycetes bacterium]|nr:DUF3798 domain-containing protein [Planctomycetota bacterium]
MFRARRLRRPDRVLGFLGILLGSLILVPGCEKKGGASSGETSPAAREIEIPVYPKVAAKPVDVGALDFKIGILTGTVSQGEDEYRGAEYVVRKYGSDKIIHKTYPDNFMTEQETTVTQITEMAKDPAVKAIIVAQAVPGTLPAIKKVRRERDDVIFLLVAPQEDPEQIAQYADLAIQTDDLMRGKTIVEKAKSMGAKTFIHYTFPRHMSMKILADRRDIMRRVCEENDMEFVVANAPDPTGDQGIAGSQKFVLEDVPRKIEAYGKDTAFFSTNCSMQEPLIRAALEGGAIFPEQCCPSPTHGYPGALGISISEDMAGDMAKIREEIGRRIDERGFRGRFGTWATSIHIVMIEACVELAKGAVHDKLELTDLGVIKWVLETTGGIKVELGPFAGHDNFVMTISENLTL